MAISQVGVTEHSSTSTTTSLTINKPSGVASGHVLIAAITSNNDSHGIPSGWTEFEGRTAVVAWQCRLYYKVAGGSEPSSYTWTVGSAGPSAGIVQAWSGVDTTTPIDGTADTLSESNEAEPWTGPSATMASANGKLFYVRGVRRTSAGSVAGTISESDANASLHISKSSLSGTGATAYVIAIASATAQYTTSGSKSGLAFSYDQTEATNYAATFGLRMAGEPADGTISSTVPAVTSSFAGEREPNSGSMDASTPLVSASMAGTHYVPATGTIDSTIPLVQTEFEGHSDLAGQLDASVPLLSVALVGETVPPDSEHVIKVEADHRAFLVVDDGITDTGLKPIKRSKVTQQ